jgi:quercetin dioxygenase-like cupin family protein
MKLRTIALAVSSFVLGVATLRVVQAQTTWMSHFQPRTEYRTLDTSTMPWRHSTDAHVSYEMKYLFKDESTHEVGMLLHYPAGQVNPAHVHSYGHGMYVLQGKLLTHRGTYGPGNFVWFPANEVVAHGAPPDEDVVVLFLRHEDMSIEHVQPAH